MSIVEEWKKFVFTLKTFDSKMLSIHRFGDAVFSSIGEIAQNDFWSAAQFSEWQYSEVYFFNK